ncbi:hypothetical protein H5410_037213 [Solanum commersonii]|uniref:RNase H type-1 domain-containing protein n=1 Tax=Solanum commersonii TaxID=4109 RepID=A0A9J5Y752_SOLCO|nr:hypothetical protein H5410_037213 [Solanum commersonii]
MWNKYYKKQIPILVQWKGGSLVWKMMLENKDILKKKKIWWETKGVSSNICHDNWTKLGPLHQIPHEDIQTNSSISDIEKFIGEEGWNYEKIQHVLPNSVVEHHRKFYNRWCMGATEEQKLWKAKLCVDDVLARCGISVVSRCTCCSNPQLNTIEYLFLEMRSTILMVQILAQMVLKERILALIRRFFVVSNENRDVVGAKGIKLSESSNIVAETIAIREGLKFYIDIQFTPHIIKTDSLTKMNILNDIWIGGRIHK